MDRSRRSVLKYLGGFTAGILLANQAKAQGEKIASDRLGKLLPQRTLGAYW